MPTDPWILALLRFGGLALAAAVFGYVLGAARCPGGRVGAALIGGVLAGVLLGPAVLGAAAPDLHERISNGYEAQTIAHSIDKRQRQRDADLVALAATGVSPEAVEEQRGQARDELAELGEARGEAIARHTKPVRQIVVGLVALACGLALGLSVPTRPTPEDLPELFPCLLAGLVGGVMEMLAVALIAQKLGGLDRAEAIAIGAAVTAGTIFARFPLGAHPGVMRQPARTALGGSALFVTMMGMWWSLPDDQAGWLLAPVLVYLIASMIRGRRAIPARARRAARSVVLWITLAPLTALLVSMTDPIGALGSLRLVALAVLVAVVSGSAFGLGAILAFKARGTEAQRANAWAMALDGYGAGVVPTRTLTLAMLVAAGALDPAWPTGGAIVLGAILGGALDALTLDAARGMLVGATRP